MNGAPPGRSPYLEGAPSACPSSTKLDDDRESGMEVAAAVLVFNGADIGFVA
jgi:hypothetical protein